MEGDTVALNALQWWLSQVAGRATLMVATADKHRAAVGDVSPATKRPQGSPLRRVSTHAEMLSAVRLCEDAFNAADIYMGEDWWRGGPDDEPTTDVEEMPYIDATACQRSSSGSYRSTLARMLSPLVPSPPHTYILPPVTATPATFRVVPIAATACQRFSAGSYRSTLLRSPPSSLKPPHA